MNFNVCTPSLRTRRAYSVILVTYVSEYIDYITRTDVHLGKNVKPSEYTHITIRMIHKRQRYEYQKQRRKDDINRKRFAKNS